MYKRKILIFAIATRIFIIILQFFSNLFIPDHDAGVFTYPQRTSNTSFYDDLVHKLLSGFLRWDAQYFMHIAKYGYTHENTLAFFPLYPLLAKIVASLASWFVTFLNEDSLLLLSFVILNVVIFAKAAVELYNLTAIVLNVDLAYKSAILFCINPASIFFVAPYTESLFSYLTFKSMLNCVLYYDKYNRKCNNLAKIIVPISLSASVRSNGLLNVAFLAYFMVQDAVKNMARRNFLKKLFAYVKHGAVLISSVYLCLIPFLFVQYYFYRQFCTDFEHNLPDFLITFIHGNNFVFPGMNSYYNQSWCLDKIPFAYSYIQSRYWNVGFLKYFEFKQLPNFLLAAPISAFLMYNNYRFISGHKRYCLNLGIFNFKIVHDKERLKKTVAVFKPKMFVFVVHELFLVVFCVLCIHVQVTTRMLCSASPVLYWFAAYSFQYVTEQSGSIRSLFLFNKCDFNQRLILYYFLSYTIVGTIMFCNFLPWT